MYLSNITKFAYPTTLCSFSDWSISAANLVGGGQQSHAG
jgi:hypothetical protein